VIGEPAVFWPIPHIRDPQDNRADIWKQVPRLVAGGECAMRLIRTLFLIIALLATATGSQGVIPLAGPDAVHSSHMTSDQMQVSVAGDHVNCDQPCPSDDRGSDTRRHHSCPSALLCAPPVASIPASAISDMAFVSMQVRYDAAPAREMISATIAPAGPPPKA
jgi:hypothetical protein